MSTRSLSLPEDLTDLIFDYADHRGVLKTWSLVSPSWRRSGQSRLYRNLLLRISYYHLDEPETIRFSEVLQQSPHLAEYVHYLRLRFRDYSFVEAGLLGDRTTIDQQQHVARMVPQFRQLTSIWLERESTYGFPPEKQILDPPLLRALQISISSPQLRRITLSGGWSFLSLNHFTSLMGASISSPSLISLEISWVSILGIPIHLTAPPERTTGPLVIIHSLTIDPTRGLLEHLAGWFAMMTRPVKVKTLSIKGGYDDGVAPFLTVLSPSIEELELPIRPIATQTLPNLNRLNQLSKLSLFQNLDTLSILQSISSDNRLQSIKMEVDPKVPFYHPAFQALDALLASQHFPHLRAVRIEVDSRYGRLAIAETMTSLTSRGILQVHPVTKPVEEDYLRGPWGLDLNSEMFRNYGYMRLRA